MSEDLPIKGRQLTYLDEVGGAGPKVRKEN